MQWLVRFRVLWGIHKSFHAFHPAPSQLRCQSFSGVGAPKWNDHDVPKEFNFASDVLDYWAQMEKEGKRGPEPALWWINTQGDEMKWNFREMRDLSCRVANVLTQTCGLQRGDHLTLILPRVPEWWLVAMGCIRTGIVFMPGTTQLKPKDILYRLQMSNSKAIVTTDTLAPEVDSVASECPTLKTKLLVSENSLNGWLDLRSLIKSASPEHTCVKSKMEDPMIIFFTSGTTGFPKMAKHNHGLAFRSYLPACRNLMQLKKSDVLWCMSDPGWILAAVGALFEPWTAGSTLFIHHMSPFDPKIIIKVLFKYPITHCLAAPAVFRMVLQQKVANLRFPTLKHCYTGGESLLTEEFEQWKKQTGILLREIYGQTETNDPEKTVEVHCGDFYNTGDKATIDEEGYIWFLGRSDDVINASGYRIGPVEVENALAEHPAVAESAVVSSPDPTRGEVVKAFIVLNPPFLSHDQDQLVKELQQHVKSVTAPYKYPRKVEFVPELPKTVTGKIKRSELRKKEWSDVSSSQARTARP
ncbi:PREDICTED: acyl-coenzyme A synthetase ACSM1, mitochondrial isoform X2 [Chinchilla lanigera]|uniref:acyl-coenzyme A synthetase ACSM1, mitochondrial isoform X2 n=1 Tax=Chinchilla lanigera TaxID=34839 RepID=UPI0006979E61|nr:PREDICTED: acyl-coenzyme A synthetase ACSM1, mitochondrial isoform X2 [Chinchilla lanigera]